MDDQTNGLGRRLAAGDQSVFAELYDRHGRTLFAAASVGPDETDDHGVKFDAKTKKGDITFRVGTAATTRPE